MHTIDIVCYKTKGHYSHDEFFKPNMAAAGLLVRKVAPSILQRTVINNAVPLSFVRYACS